MMWVSSLHIDLFGSLDSHGLSTSTLVEVLAGVLASGGAREATLTLQSEPNCTLKSRTLMTVKVNIGVSIFMGDVVELLFVKADVNAIELLLVASLVSTWLGGHGRLLAHIGVRATVLGSLEVCL